MLYSFFISQRRSGTTTLLKEIAKKNDVWILVPNEADKKQFGDKAISFSDIEKTIPESKKPVLVDNHTMLKLHDVFKANIIELKNSIKDRDMLINSIEHLISNYRQNKVQHYVSLKESDVRFLYRDKHCNYFHY